MDIFDDIILIIFPTSNNIRNIDSPVQYAHRNPEYLAQPKVQLEYHCYIDANELSCPTKLTAIHS